MKKEENKLVSLEDIEKNKLHIPSPPKDFQEIKYEIKKSSKKIYLVLWFLIFSSVSITLYFVFTKQIVLSVIAGFITIPLTLMSLIIMAIKFIVYDYKKLRKTIIKKLSHNFIIADIFKNGKRIEEKVCLINEDGKTISDGKKDYVLDNKGVWYDGEGFPHLFYLDNLPNSVIFEFAEDLNKYVLTLQEKKTIPSKNGILVDVSYSSENLQLLKKDKIFAELHRNPDTDKIIMLLIGAMIIMGIIFMVIFMVSRGGK